MKKNLKRLLSQSKLSHHKTSKKEIGNLLNLVKRDIKDAKIKGLSNDRKFATAYNAVLQLGTILLHCNGYRTKGTGSHYTVFQAMKIILTHVGQREISQTMIMPGQFLREKQ